MPHITHTYIYVLVVLPRPVGYNIRPRWSMVLYKFVLLEHLINSWLPDSQDLVILGYQVGIVCTPDSFDSKIFIQM